jgi:hypothetical protein
VWSQIDPARDVYPKLKPQVPTALDISKYKQKPALGVNADREPLLPEVPSELLLNGLKA